MTEYVLAITDGGTTDWITSSRGKVQVIHIDFDDLANRELLLDEIKAEAGRVGQLPRTFPQREDVINRLLRLLLEREEAGVLC